MRNEITDKLSGLISGNEVIHVCGLGGVGKTQFCENIRQELGGVIVASDWYLKYPSSQRHIRMREALQSGDPIRIEQEENPQNWYDWESLIHDLGKLSAGDSITIKNAWNQVTGEKDLDIEVVPQVDKPIWCDGIYLLHSPIIEAADISVLLVASPNSVRQRAEHRDNHRSSPEYLAYKDSLMRKYDLPYFEKHKSAATLVIDNTNFKNPLILK